MHTHAVLMTLVLAVITNTITIIIAILTQIFTNLNWRHCQPPLKFTVRVHCMVTICGPKDWLKRAV